jgi:hypothetical protein
VKKSFLFFIEIHAEITFFHAGIGTLIVIKGSYK